MTRDAHIKAASYSSVDKILEKEVRVRRNLGTHGVNEMLVDPIPRTEGAKESLDKVAKDSNVRVRPLR